ncbi:Exopolyphosphatase [compost metagenome]
MKSSHKRIGIVDIGSNSIRLAIYEVTEQEQYRLINENKESARLSEKINENGVMNPKDILSIVPILREFQDICNVYHCSDIIVAATAAIRNAANAEEIVSTLYSHTGLKVTILSGEEEAYFGYLGVVAGMEIEDGFIIDIGGGSSEITLFLNRKLVSSVSLPIGAVNTQVTYGGADDWSEQNIAGLRKRIEELVSGHDWIKAHPGLTLIGLGGTIRALGKLDQRRSKYPMRVAHQYSLENEYIEYFAQLLPSMPLEKRKRLDGLSKTRADIIVPGLLILQAIIKATGAAKCVVSGTGLREGLLLNAIGAKLPAINEVVCQQVDALLSFHSTVDSDHLVRVRQYADDLCKVMGVSASDDGEDCKKLVHVAAMLYKIGSGIRYHQYDKHSLYWMTNAPIGGLTHRESILSAYIADYRSSNGKRLNVGEYRSLLKDSDVKLIQQLGSLLQVAVALDSSETGAIEAAEAELDRGALLLKLKCRSQACLELRQLEAAAKNFKKVWDVRLEWENSPSSKR